MNTFHKSWSEWNRKHWNSFELFHQTFLRILHRTLKPCEQNHAQTTYCAPRSPRDGIIDWSQPAQTVWNLIRGLTDPYPGAFTYHECQPLKIWRARIFASSNCGTPVQVVKISEEGVYVIAEDHRAVIL
jgi:UDP-4-amino-4-deoxy-L-arabinose formyltransferase/UDP-glucuronic acid dehydrogenase (UDP-4-keto-hexauronic acid decarboxylating)